MNDIEYLENWIIDLSQFNDEKEAIEVLKKAIQALQEKQEREWVLCSERLPNENGNYLVTYQDDIIDDYVIVRQFWNGDFSHIEWYEKHTGRKAIAWQPLPKPYRKGEDNE